MCWLGSTLWTDPAAPSTVINGPEMIWVVNPRYCLERAGV
jgi:hypothetical protein